MTEKCEYSDSLVEYINNTLNHYKKIEIDDHLEICQNCQQDLQLWKTISDELHYEKETVSPPNDLFFRILISVRDQKNLYSIFRRAFLLINSQFGIIRHEFWFVSFLVTILGIFTGMISGHTEIIQILSPFISSVSLAQIFTPELDPAMDIEFATPTSSRQILLARIVLSYGYNLILAFTAHLILYGLTQNVFIWDIVLSWLAPMTFLSALALILSIHLGMNNSIIISSGIWLLRILSQNFLGNIQELVIDEINELIRLINSIWNEPYLLLILSLGLVVISIFQAGRKNSTILKSI